MCGLGWGEVEKFTNQGSPEKQNQLDIYTEIYKKRFIIGICSCSYRGQEVPPPAFCKAKLGKPVV